jgi:multidrug efflux pump subunit AcrA (membrane-fusion protein)
MRPGNRRRLTARVVLILTIATGVALAIIGASAASAADTGWASPGQVSVSGEGS